MDEYELERKPNLRGSRAWKFFWLITARPKLVLMVVLGVVALGGSYVPQLHKDTSSDAFIPTNHPALIYREKVKKLFGLKDPMVIAVVGKGKTGVFNPRTLRIIYELTEQASHLKNIDPERVTSLSTENNITGTQNGMYVKKFYDTPPTTQAEADQIRKAVMDFPLYLGSMVSKDGSATLIVLELLDQGKAKEVYTKLLALVNKIKKTSDVEIHIAGEGAVSGYMGAYIDADAQRLNPIAALIITLIIFIAFRTLRGIILPNIVVLATLATALGAMAAAGVSFFVITNALPVILIGIAVADSIHIFGQYYEDMALYPDESAREVTTRAMCGMWKPITLTSLTTMAGFLGLSIASVMPPMQYFGLFAMIGVLAAWIYSLTILPAALSLLKLKPSKAFKAQLKSPSEARSSQGLDHFALAMRSLGRWVNVRYKWVVFIGLLVVSLGIAGAFKLELNENRIDIFQKDEPIVKADTVINTRFDGAHYLDIVIETPNKEDLFKLINLKKIDALQQYLEGLASVQGTSSIVDYLKQMNRSLNENKKTAYRLPQNADIVAQYFLLYTASGGSSDFEKEIDYDYRLANIRVRLNTGVYTDEKAVVEQAQNYINTIFNSPGIKATLSGRVNLDYHWIKRLGDSHFGSVATALLLVLLVAGIGLRSMVAGLITIIPVVISVLFIYAVMGFLNIWLAVGTSMFAAIAIGLGVDFSVHTMERLKVLIRERAYTYDQAVDRLYSSTGRALLFNFAALALGFGVLISSEVVPLVKFGGLVAVAVTVSFIASITLLPALLKMLRPSFLFVTIPGEDNVESINEITSSEVATKEMQ